MIGGTDHFDGETGTHNPEAVDSIGGTDHMRRPCAKSIGGTDQQGRHKRNGAGAAKASGQAARAAT